MLNQTIFLKLKQRLNKLDSKDYDNIEPWQMIEAFNKGMVDWCRRNLHGLNVMHEGDEGSKRRIDDLQVLLTPVPVALIERPTYMELPALPGDYFEWKRIHATAKSKCCPNSRPMVIYLAEEGNVDNLLRDENKKPSFDFAETFCTLMNGSLRIYTNGEFTIDTATLYYYRQPRRIEVTGVIDPYTLVASVADVLCEFKDDIIEVLIDEAAKIIAGDIEAFNQEQGQSNSVENNN